MKRKLLLVGIALICAINVFSQDIIVTKKAEKITVKLEKIGVDEVEYRKWDNQTGPLYIMKKEAIASIIFENGQVEVFETPSAQTSQPQNGNSNKYSNQDAGMNYTTFDNLDDDAMSVFLEKADRESYDIFHKGEILKRTGKGLVIPGAILAGTGLFLSAFSFLAFEEMYELYFIGLACFAVGQALVIASIPLMVVGGTMKRRGKNNYEDKYFKEQSASLNFNINANGIGLALKF